MSQRPIRNRQVRLKARPAGIPDANHFEVSDGPVPEPQAGQVLVRNIYLSVDPAMRGWVGAAANYSEPVPIGAVMRSLAAGRVEASRHPDFPALSFPRKREPRLLERFRIPAGAGMTVNQM
jgi:hypothetical protein